MLVARDLHAPPMVVVLWKFSGQLIDRDMGFPLVGITRHLRNVMAVRPFHAPQGLAFLMEYGLGNMVSKEGDVYSFGIMLIEMMILKRSTDSLFNGGLNLHEYAKSALPYQVTKVLDTRHVDDGASDGYDNEIVEGSGRKFECIKSIIEIGLDCSVESPQDRMAIDVAIQNLQSTRDIFFFGT